MGKRGPKPQPTKLKVLRGNPGKRPLNDAEPQPEATIPKCPDHLKDEARREWFRMSKKLHAIGLLTEIDKAALAMYCSLWGKYVEAENKLNDDKAWVKTTESGYQYVTAWMQISNKAMQQMKSILAEFGMTPSARSKVKVEKPKEENPFEKFLGSRAA